VEKFSKALAERNRVANIAAAISCAAFEIFCGILCATLAIPGSFAHASAHASSQPRSTIIRIAEAGPGAKTPDETGASDDDDKDVPPAQVAKYIDAYKAMQKDHNLTAEQAASKEGLTIAQFRSIEGRIERDDTLRERVRKALRKATSGGKESAD
jgi:hypothetical protein